jgi:hypothetical protein
MREASSIATEQFESAPPASQTAVPLRTGVAVPGRLAALTAMATLVSSVPLPVLPGRALLSLRGAVAHETAARHGLCLGSEARQILARPGTDDRLRNVLRQSFELVAKRILRRVGPLAPLGVALRALEIYALGHLMDRYFATFRREGSAHIQEAEARRLRTAIDAAVLRAFMPSTRPVPLALPQASEDLRDSFTRWIDLLLIGGATLPSYIERRLEAAFDEVIEQA